MATAQGLQPRLGIALRPVAGSSLVIRAGYGIYRNTGVYQPIALLLAQQPPLSKTLEPRKQRRQSADARQRLPRAAWHAAQHLRRRSRFPRRLRAQLAGARAARSARVADHDRDVSRHRTAAT